MNKKTYITIVMFSITILPTNKWFYNKAMGLITKKYYRAIQYTSI